MSRQGLLTFALAVLLLPWAGRDAAAQAVAPPGLKHIRYEKDDSIFPNPERGFFRAFNPPGQDNHRKGILGDPHVPFRVSELKALRDLPEAITLVRDVIRLGQFWDGDISAQRLADIEADWSAARVAGVKVVPRFVYSWGMENSDPEEATIRRHIEQLRPLMARNADVIAWVQGGFLGGCGEGNASEHYLYNGWDNGSRKWQKLNEAGRRVYEALLEALPRERFVTLRYPRFKWDMLGWGPSTAQALSPGHRIQRLTAGPPGPL